MSAKQSPNKIGHSERNDTHMKTKQSRNVMHSSIRYVQKGNISLHLNKLNQNNYVFKCEIEKCYKRRKGINVFSWSSTQQDLDKQIVIRSQSQ
jgi:hypothetical protein